jgi:predicted unusual protein kinase regulating ubiquinone biosynthesis (AarF/ABC1/UbiB family)
VASLAQVHVAFHRESGKRVAVKVWRHTLRPLVHSANLRKAATPSSCRIL